MSLHRGLESAAACLLLPLNEENEIDSQCAPVEQLRSCARDGKNRAFIVGHAAPVKIPVAAVEGERVRGPAVRGRRNDIIVAAKCVNVSG